MIMKDDDDHDMMFYIPFNIIQVILRRWKDDNERPVQWRALQLWAEFHLKQYLLFCSTVSYDSGNLS